MKVSITSNSSFYDKYIIVEANTIDEVISDIRNGKINYEDVIDESISWINDIKDIEFIIRFDTNIYSLIGNNDETINVEICLYDYYCE